MKPAGPREALTARCAWQKHKDWPAQSERKDLAFDSLLVSASHGATAGQASHTPE
jgi:hypothetical protein